MPRSWVISPGCPAPRKSTSCMENCGRLRSCRFRHGARRSHASNAGSNPAGDAAKPVTMVADFLFRVLDCCSPQSRFDERAAVRQFLLANERLNL